MIIIILVTGCDRPALKFFNKHVRDGCSCKWHDLGLELLKPEFEEKLYIIKANNNELNERCKEMFHLWLTTDSSATWLKLIQALRVVDLKTLADKIEGMLMPMEEPILQTDAGTLYCSFILS